MIWNRKWLPNTKHLLLHTVTMSCLLNNSVLKFRYVKREVEPMGKECEHVQVLALTEYLRVRVKMEYLDGQ